MINLVHLSDVHFGREVPKVINGLTEALHSIQPERIVISGDLTQRAKHSEFKRFQAFRDQLPAPCFIIPGNHDLSAHRLIERFLYPWKKWRHYINADLEPTLNTDDYLAIGKNTARRMGWYMDWSRGRINDAQIADVHKKIEQANEDQLRFLVAHHPFWLPATYEFRKLIGSRDEALEEFSAGGLDMIMSGHVHMAYAEVVKGVIVSHAGTTTSDRLLPDQPNSFNRITGDRNQLVIELYEWNGEHFASHSQQHFKRTEHGWTRSKV